MKRLHHRQKSLRTFICVAAIAAAMSALTPAHAATGSVAYTYDPLGRITTASYDTGVCIVYARCQWKQDFGKNQRRSKWRHGRLGMLQLE